MPACICEVGQTPATEKIRFLAPWDLLPVEPQDRVAARHLGWHYHPLLLLHPAFPDLSVAAPQRSSVQLDFLDVRNVHSGVRHHPSDGDMDDLASHIFPVRGGKGNYGACALISMKP